MDGAAGAVPASAATVVLIRPGQDGFEVLLTRRPATMAFAAGIHVFPGGRVDPADERPDHELAAGLTADEAARRLGNTLAPLPALAHYVAAVREAREETGIAVAAADLIHLTRWVTPPGLARRFDARFFAAFVPGGTEIVGGSPEIDQAEWIGPGEALVAAASGRLPMLLPTLITLQQLRPFRSRHEIERAFHPGLALSPSSVAPLVDGLAEIDQRWVAGIPGRRATGWLVGTNDLVLVNPADPTGETAAVVDAAVAARGARIVGIALTGPEPECAAGVEIYAAGRGLPVIVGAGGESLAPYPVQVLGPGDQVPFGDLPMALMSKPIPGAKDRHVVGDWGYRLRGGRVLPRSAGLTRA